MEDNRYFMNALGNMTADFAYIKGIRHLYDCGFKIEEIQQKCSYPVSIQKIEKVISDYENEKNSPEGNYAFIEERDHLGRKSFRRVPSDN